MVLAMDYESEIARRDSIDGQICGSGQSIIVTRSAWARVGLRIQDMRTDAIVRVVEMTVAMFDFDREPTRCRNYGKPARKLR